MEERVDSSVRDALAKENTILVSDLDCDEILAMAGEPADPKTAKAFVKDKDGNLVPLNEAQSKRLYELLEDERRSKRNAGELLALLTGVAAMAPPGCVEAFEAYNRANPQPRPIRTCAPGHRPTMRRNDKCKCGSKKKYKVCCFTKGL